MELRGCLSVNSSLALAAAAAAGAGVAFLPLFAATSGLESGRLRRVLTTGRSEPQALYALYPQHRFTSRNVRLFVEHLGGQYQPTATTVTGNASCQVYRRLGSQPPEGSLAGSAEPTHASDGPGLAQGCCPLVGALRTF